MNRISNVLKTVSFRKTLVAVALVGGLSVATGAFADRHDDRGSNYRDDRYDHRDDHNFRDYHDDRHTDVKVDIDLAGGFAHSAPPRVEERTTQVWVEPVYRTTTDRVWVAPVYRTETTKQWRDAEVRDETTNVWVPDRFEQRTVTTGHGRWTSTRVETVLVAPAHYETRCTPVVIKEGGWHNVDAQVLVCDGHWDQVQRQVIVAPGHYETRVDTVTCEPQRTSGFSWFLGIGR